VSNKVITDRKVRVGVIGAGVWAVQSHIPTLIKRTNEVELTGLCRLGLEEAKKTAEKFGFWRFSEDYREILALQLDYVIVSSPALLHFEHARAALESGAHVLLEKPVTLTTSDCKELLKLAKSNQLNVLIPYGWNYMPIFLRAQELIEQIGIGEVENIDLQMGSCIKDLILGDSLDSSGNPELPVDPNTYGNAYYAGGGYLNSGFTHALGYLFGLFNLEPQTVFAKLFFDKKPGIETHAALAVSFTNGALASMSASAFHLATQMRHRVRLSVYGSKGQLEVSIDGDWIRFWTSRGLVELNLGKDTQRYHCEGPPNILLDLIKGKNVRNNSSLEVGLRTVEIVQNAHVSNERNALIRVT